jgi:heterodisulfide reductase subunit A2
LDSTSLTELIARSTGAAGQADSRAADTKGDVLVVGAGISGIQAALDLAGTGFRVFLVDKAPALGGKMSQLDKTFPSNDCSMCIESPKFIECSRHPNIEILTNTEVVRVEGEAGDFTVTLNRKPRYVNEDICTGCTTCVQYCPVDIPDPYNQNLSLTKAVHIHFSQAVPLVTYIDPEKCLYLQDEKCQICAGVCKHGAIDLHQKPKRMDVKVGAVVLAAGYEVFDPAVRGDYGYGQIRNVVTSLEYERFLSATGPSEGEVRRPSDGRHPHRIAWIQCVGSRQVIPGGNSYCSAVCCAYTQKQVILTKDHNAEIDATVFHNDIRAFSKDFERYYQRAAKLPKVRFIRSYVSIGREIPETGNVTIRYATDEQGVQEEEFDLVVLSVGLTAPKDAKDLAGKFGIELDSRGFCRTHPLKPVETSRQGIFVSGAFQGPADIPESVASASGAAAACAQLLMSQRGKLSRERVYPPERDVSQEEPKVGVFVCHCGANIGRVVNVPQVVHFASRLKNVVHAQESLFACSTDNAQQISDVIRDKGLNRVVIAACTPRTHEPLFRDTVREGGINQYFFDMANIREHCAWVHSREKDEATQKAKELVRMSVARTTLLQPLQEIELPIDKTVLVIGGGLAGMTASLNMADQGFEVYLVEKEAELGGMARRLHYTLEGVDVQAFLAELVARVYRHPAIHVATASSVEEVAGYVGNFETRVSSETRTREIRHGAIIVATGAEEHRPTEYLYGQDEKVVTLLDLEERISRKEKTVANARSVVMIQCVGCRSAERNYCSRVCCSQSVKNALKLKEQRPETEVTIVFRDMRTYGLKEDYYRLAQAKGVRFVRYTPEDRPQVEAVQEGGRSVLRVTVKDPVLGRPLALDADVVALAAAVVPSSTSPELSRMLKVPLSPDGFYQEAHVKLRPLDFAADGIFLCGTAHYPKHISETLSQAYGAASRAINVLSQDSIKATGAVCGVHENACVACGACISACSYDAIGFHETKQGRKARVNPVLCKGDGLCNTKCPTGAIYLSHYTNEEILAQIDAA